MTGRIIIWFSCGAASAVAAKLVLQSLDERKEGREIVIARNWVKEEHPDNDRMQAECERWLGHPIIQVSDDRFGASVMEVQQRVKAIRFKKGAPCTLRLKKEVRHRFQKPNDIHVFGLHVGEEARVNDFLDDEPGVRVWLPLIEAGLTKEDCHRMLAEAGIEQAAMYRLGYTNNNCIGCVKGGMGYWNKIRRDFPEVFERQAKMERMLGTTVIRVEGPRTPDGHRTTKAIYLDELDPNRGNHKKEKPIKCGIICESPEEKTK